MAYVRDNSKLYHPGALDRTKDRLAFEVFVVEVLTIDYERKVLTVEDVRNRLIYTEITAFPAVFSSLEGGETALPEQGARGVACNWVYESGFHDVVILSWLASGSLRTIDAIAFRPVEGDEIQGWSDRLRGTYRKTYPGQKTSVYKGGYSERIDIGWDRQALDWSRDRLDPARQTWTRITGREVEYTNAGLKMIGPVNRPDATNLTKRRLPDGTFEYVSYLQPGGTLKQRYTSGQQDIIPFTEATELVQEFALDYTLPAEVIQTDLFDTVLGTLGDPWGRTTVTSPSGQVAYDSESFMITQTWDHPTNTAHPGGAVGPTLKEGPTPQRRAFIIEKAQGTLVGYNRFDKSTYGLTLKPSVFALTPNTAPLGGGRFSVDVAGGYTPVVDSEDHVEARLAASCMSVRFPYEYNTSRFDMTKEGLLVAELGATLPKENSGFAGTYEHPHGAGRSLEVHSVGSIKAVIGKNRDEEEALDIVALGQTVLRLGADDTSLPDARRDINTQIRQKGDAVASRDLQYWASAKLSPGDIGDPTNKTGGESVSIWAGLDGGVVMRFGARNAASKRRHFMNGYKDAQGTQPWSVGDSSRIDSHSSGRPTYGAGDATYLFNNLTQAGSPQIGTPPYAWSGQPVTNMDAHGLSLDLHTVRDILLRVGANPASGQSILIDTAGGIVLGLGKDMQGRSVTGTLTGGMEITIKANNQGKALRLEIDGDIDITHRGNLHWACGGDFITECTNWRHITKCDRVFTQQKAVDSSLATHTIEAADIIHSEGFKPETDADNPAAGITSQTGI
jgi:hypothetical protein